MKPVKNLAFAALLVTSIAFNTIAGDIDHPGIVAPPPPPPQTMTTAPDETDMTGSQQTIDTSDYLFLDALVALLSAY